MLILPERKIWTRQPQSLPRVDRAAIASGLVGLVWMGPGKAIDLVTGEVASLAGSPLAATPGGMARVSAASTDGVYYARMANSNWRVTGPLSFLTFGNHTTGAGTIQVAGYSSGADGYMLFDAYGLRVRRATIGVSGGAASVEGGNWGTTSAVRGLTWTGTTLTGYDNGVAFGSATSSGTVTYDGTFSRLGWLGNPDRSAAGGLGYWMALYNRALSAAEIRAISTSDRGVWRLLSRRRSRTYISLGGGSTTNNVTTSLGAAVQAAQAATASIAAGVQTGRLQTATTDAAVLAAQSAQTTLGSAVSTLAQAVASLDAALRTTGATSTAADAAIVLARSAATALDLAVQGQRSATTSVSAQVQAASGAAVSLDAYVQAGNSVSTALGAALLSAALRTAGLDAGVLLSRTATAGMGAALQLAANANTAIDAALQALRSATAGINAQVQAGTGLAASMDSAITAAAAASSAVDAAIVRAATTSTALGAAVALQRSLSAAMDGHVLASRIAAATLSAYVYDASGGGVTLLPGQRQILMPDLARAQRRIWVYPV